MVIPGMNTRPALRTVFGAVALATLIAGLGAAPASARDRDDGHRGWAQGHQWRGDYDRDWRGYGWRAREGYRWSPYGYYVPPPVVYPPEYYAPPPVIYDPPAYYPSLSFGFRIR